MSLGPRSLAGFITPPAFIPKHSETAVTTSAKNIPYKYLGTLMFLGSMAERIAIIRTEVATICKYEQQTQK
jgi:hypothetical protein